MDTSKIKSYAPQARNDFIQAVTERANLYGIFGDTKIESAEIKGDAVLIGDRTFTKKEGDFRESLVSNIKRKGFEQVIESCAYIWFNRFIALRYMELHDYFGHGFRVLSNRSGSDIPEILENAAEVDFEGLNKDTVIELRLAGNKDDELYRLLIIAQYNVLHKTMPFLFDKIDSEAELLLPANLLHSNSIIRKLIHDIDEESWENVEIIGWIYQFYISEKKDQVIGKVVKSEDIPAATQLFTPNWIVKYMVQNTLGRMWLATYPDSFLLDKMEYYIEPAEQEPEVQRQLDEITPKELNPEKITFLDPACGSGHILIEAYNIFKDIYLERGYRTREIPRLILEKNIFGLDICDRAAQLACFAVLMKAREDDRRILSRDDLKLNVMALQESNESDIKNIDIFFKDDESIQKGLKGIVNLFNDAKTFGSLITVPESLQGKRELFETAIYKNVDEVWRTGNVDRLKSMLQQSEILEKQYNCVVTNPPYIGSKWMNNNLKKYAKNLYPDSKSDVFAMFTEQSILMTVKSGFIGLVMPYVWMFISSYKKFREKIITISTLSSLIQLEYNAFEPACVPVATFNLFTNAMPKYKGNFIKLSDFKGHQNQAPKTLEAIQNPNCGWRYTAATEDFKKISSSPIAYWVSEGLRDIFISTPKLENFGYACVGLQTGDIPKFIREWFEVDISKIGFEYKKEVNVNNKKWFPYNKGGGFRKWYGNQNFVVNWGNDGEDIKNDKAFRLSKGLIEKKNSECWNKKYYFKSSLSWSLITSGKISFKYFPNGFIFDISGPSFFSKNKPYFYLGLLNSKVILSILSILSPTLSFVPGTIKKIPVIELSNINLSNSVTNIVKKTQKDWNSFESSWDFTNLPLLEHDNHQQTLKETYLLLCYNWKNMTSEIQRLEEENNRIFIEAYGLQDELTPEVPLNEITLTCNPHYRYGSNKTEEELETLLQTDTIKELISYSIGCMMGRYSLDHEGLIYAHSGNIDFDTSKYKTFPADDDGIIPIMDQEWFPDDASSRFIEFLKVAWSPEALEENLKFVAESLKSKTDESPVDTIRRYISTSFFKDHLKTYKKRPIYWLFSSGKQKAFQCLVYLHRYNESTLSRIRSSYVTPLQGHFSTRIELLKNEKEATSTASAQKKIQKEIEFIKKKQDELRKFDDELRHYADKKISINLDDGVKVNYGKFGNLLVEKRAITGKK